MAADARALDVIDAVSGEDQAFTAGYSGRSTAEKYHRDQTYGVEELLERPDGWSWGRTVKTSVTYDGNIFSARQDPKDDLIYTTGLPMTWTRQRKDGYVKLFYDINYVTYVENEKLGRANHQMGTTVGYRIDKLTMTLNESFRPSSAVSVGERTELKTAESSRVTTFSNALSLNTDYDVSTKTRIGWDYAHNLFFLPSAQNAATLSNFSTQKHTFGPRFSYQWRPRVGVSGRAVWTVTDYYLETGAPFDSVESAYGGGINLKLTDKTSLYAGADLVHREYEQFEIEPTKGYRFQSSINRRFSPKISGTITYTRDNTSETLDRTLYSSFGQTQQQAGINLSWFLTTKITIEGSASAGLIENEGLITRRDPDNPTLTFTRPKEDDFYQYSLSLRWRPRPAFSFLLAYFFFKKNSTFKDFEYDNQRFVSAVEYVF
ncbi:MAG: hypothetical protein MOGMAGMI_00445 [Candidatus Omnitrophica bacterium]|nr:hypothetical protein [Candidatus Omnitrophota bacterium]